jgi:hypothetical protein
LKFPMWTVVVTLGSIANLETSESSKYKTWFAMSICRIEGGATCARAGRENAAAQRAVTRAVFQCRSCLFPPSSQGVKVHDKFPFRLID